MVTNLQVLNFFDELNILLRQALLVRGDVNNGAVQFLDFDVKFADIDFKFLNGLRVSDLLFGYVFHLGQQLVNFGLKFGLLLLGSGDKESGVAITRYNTITEHNNSCDTDRYYVFGD